MAMEVVHEDITEGSMQCPNHPYKNSTPGGICAFCLQEKLGKLVSSSLPVAIFSSSTSSSSPSFRSDFGGSNPTSAAADGGAAHLPSSSILPFVFKRSKSTANPRTGIMHFLDGNFSDGYTPHRRGFWSFLYMSKQKKSDKNGKALNFTPTTPTTACANVGPSSRERKREDFGENVSPGFDRKVSRSRSVGCGSRSFSGDFFERISTGFGDCTLRRVESQREGKANVQSVHRKSGNNGVNGQDCIKERVRCGGIFSGFMMTSSSSSLSSSYWEERHLSHGRREKGWGWALASPMRAFGKPSSGKRDGGSSKNVAPNLAAIPSLLAVSG